MFAVGGQHTATAIAELIDEVFEGKHPKYQDPPEPWFEWPASTLFFPDSLENHLPPVLALGTLDNMNIQMKGTFTERIWKARRIFEESFGSVEAYEAVQNAREDENGPRTQFNKKLEQSLLLKKGQLGHFRTLVACSTRLWPLYWRIINREHVALRKGRKVAPMGSITELLPFISMPEPFLIANFTSLLEGTITWTELLGNVKEVAADMRLREAFEYRYNEEYNTSKKRGRAKKNGKWVSWDTILKKIPTLNDESLTYRPIFMKEKKGKLGPLEEVTFNEWVQKIKRWANSSPTLLAYRKGNCVLPTTFREFVKQEVAATLGRADAKVDFIENLTQSSGVFLIHDRTENLPLYLDGKATSFGKSFPRLLFLFSLYRCLFCS